MDTGYGSSVGLRDRSSKTVRRGVQAMLARIRLAHNKNDKVTVRFHSDMDKCHTVPVRKRLQQELEQLAARIAAGKSAKIV